MAGKEGSAAELVGDQALLLAARLGEVILALADDPDPETLARAEKVSRLVKLAADAGKAIVAMEAAAGKALAGAPEPAARASRPGEGDGDGLGETDSDEMDMDDDHLSAYDLDRIERMRDRVERRIAEILGRDEHKSAPAGLRTAGPGAPGHAPLGLGGQARAAPA